VARALDHLVVAVRDLDAACRFYERLGFQVGARNRHPWGTENRLIQLPGTFLELITVGEGAEIPPHAPRLFSFGAFIRDRLARREGLAMLVLDSENAKADAALFAQAGIGDFEPFFFERRGRGADGTEIQVAFTLAFASDTNAPHAGFFVCQQHHPEVFWSPALQEHPNRATGMSTVVLATPQPEHHAGFLTGLTGVTPARPAGSGLSFALARGRIDVMTLEDAGAVYGSVEADRDEACFVAFGVRVAEIDRLAPRLEAAGIPHYRIGSRMVVPASAAFGVAIAFEPA
jgi:catechol 2,3-dioxygenase-like lactoylglutathione lyase family enzyme